MQARPALVSLVLGAVAATGFAPLDLWPLTLVAIAAWIAIVHAAPSLRAALWRGWMFGLGHFTVNNNWFQHAFDFQDAMPPVLGYFAAVALALYLAVFPMVAAGLAWRFGRGFGGHPDGSVDGGTRVDQVVGPGPDPAYVLIFAAGWIASEWLRSVLFTGYAWDPLGVVWLPAIGVARLSATIGTYALSGVTVAAAGAVLMLAQRRWALPAAVIPALVVAALSALWTNAPSASADAPRVRVVQPDIGQEDRSETDGERVLSALEKLSGNPGSTPRLIVWPEGVVRDYLEDGYPFYAYGWSSPAYLRRRIARLLGPDDILLTGGTSLSFDRDDKIVGATNSVFAIDGQARLRGRYDKAHLVPYGEYLPMPWLLKPLGLARLVPGDIDFTSGNGPGNLTLPGFGAVGMQICYEIIFSGRTVDRAHRPRLLFNPSNDAWFGTWGPPQHLAQARMRAIEEGLPIVRATPTGISAVISADGRLLGTVPHEKAGAVELPIPPALVVTPFARIGNLASALVAAAMIAIAVALRRRDR